MALASEEKEIVQAFSGHSLNKNQVEKIYEDIYEIENEEPIYS